MSNHVLFNLLNEFRKVNVGFYSIKETMETSNTDNFFIS